MSASQSPAAGAEGSRQERKERTRQAILAAALRLSADGGLVAVSLRQVARDVGIVPTAFYRHFDSVEELGLVLVDESFVSLRAMLRDVRREATLEGVIPRSVDVLLDHVRRQPAHFRFIARERNGGSAAIREAIRRELALAQRELADDIARIPGTEGWSRDDLLTMCDLIVTAMVSTAEKIMRTHAEDEAEVVRVARTQLRMLVVGALNWKSRT
ncbi:TetR family transcriptional regulator [Nocardioides mangrovicus]|uniref:TetR family transcriptional regulator n=1 Tax=Nocardioides mangrovicus TaxID=2478913 RepID=A0A3L8P6H7_9ACTN|nr:TetR family transcriptional regulator [Nocardioides mangrovicus]RLV51010.1 TetR family transcriptional regulator [Nocardioides mangrovicus]